MSDASPREPNAPPLAGFFALAFILAWIFWVPAALLFRADDHTRIPAGLVALQTLGAVAPSVAALVVLRVTGRRAVITGILNRYRRWRVDLRWYAAAMLLTPGLTLLSLAATAVLEPGFEIPPTSPLGDLLAADAIWVVVLTFPVQLAGMMFSSPLLEEFGWRGYAQPALQERMFALPAATLLGVLWGLWHLPLTMAYGHDIAAFLAAITAHSILAAWLLNSTGSMLIAMVFHASLNVSQTSLSTGRADWLAIGLTWLAVLVVVARTGPAHLARHHRLRLPVPEAHKESRR